MTAILSSGGGVKEGVGELILFDMDIPNKRNSLYNDVIQTSSEIGPTEVINNDNLFKNLC